MPQVEVLPSWIYLTVVLLTSLTTGLTLFMRHRFAALEQKTRMEMEEVKRSVAEAESQATQAKSYSKSVETLSDTLKETLVERRDNTQATREQTVKLGDLVDALNKRDLVFADLHNKHMDGIKALQAQTEALPLRISEDMAKLLESHHSGMLGQFRAIAESVSTVSNGVDMLQRAVEAQTAAQTLTADQINQHSATLRGMIVNVADKLDENFRAFLQTINQESRAA